MPNDFPADAPIANVRARHLNLHLHGVAILEAASPQRFFDRRLRAELLRALDEANADSAVRAVVIALSGFGADAGAEDGAVHPDARTLADAIEASAKIVIAAIAGRCEGAPFEVALAAHGRVARTDASLGLPGIRLGLVPRAGGSQRLPRLVGLEEALDMLLSGAARTVGALRDTALFDAVVPQGEMDAALELAGRSNPLSLTSPTRFVRTGERAISDPQREAFMQFCRTTVAARPKAGPAAARCVELVAASASMPVARGLELEAQTFEALQNGAWSRALQHIASAERCVTQAAATAPGARPIGSVAIVGAGTMGGGIAMAFANAGIRVLLMDVDAAALARGMQAIERNWSASAARGKLTQEEAAARLALVRKASSYDDLAEADLFIEAVFESLDVKQAVLVAIDRVARPGAVIATNTSALDLDTLAAFTQRPADVVGLHFFSPAHVMKLLEVVRGRATSEETLATVLALARRIGKVPVVAGVCDGFIGNRMLARYVAAADLLVQQGTAPEQVDKALERFGFAMGPFRMGDLAGLDVAQAGRKRRAAANPERNYSQLADALCEAGRFGQKCGAGWYRYEAGKRDALVDPAAEEIIARWREALAIKPHAAGDEEIVLRCVLALANEGARALQDGIAARASDIDVVYVNGYGFPAHRGGPMHHARELGFANVVRALERIAREPGSDDSWQPAPLLRHLAASGAVDWNIATGSQA